MVTKQANRQPQSHTHTVAKNDKFSVCVFVFHSRVSYLMGDSKSCSQANVLIDAAASLRLTHPSYRSQTCQTHTQMSVYSYFFIFLSNNLTVWDIANENICTKLLKRTVMKCILILYHTFLHSSESLCDWIIEQAYKTWEMF